MRYQLLFLDVDGTLLESSTGLTEEVRHVISLIRQEGMTPVIATGRPHQSARALVDSLGGGIPIVANGGAVGYDADGSKLWHHVLPLDVIEDVEAEAQSLGAQLFLYTADHIFAHPVNEASDRYARLLQIVVSPGRGGDIVATSEVYAAALRLPVEEASRLEARWRVRWLDRAHVLQSVPTLLEVVPAGVNKGSALRRMAELYGVEVQACAAIGDGPGDRDMIEVAGCGAWVANSDPVYRTSGHWVSSRPYTEGVREFVQRLKRCNGGGNGCDE